MSKEKIGNIDGHDIFVETGPDYPKMLMEAVRRRVETKKLRDGQRYMMIVDFDGRPFLAETKITKWTDR